MTNPNHTPLVVSEIALLTDSEAVVLEKMAVRCERYAATGEQPLPKAERMCLTCPFRGAAAAYRKEAALIPAQDWPCHTYEGEHCAGHHAAQSRFGLTTPSAIRALNLAKAGTL